MIINTARSDNGGLIGVLGGSFDPVHFGHIKPTLEIIHLLDLDLVRLMPCRISPFKQVTCASARHRVAMLQLIAANVPEFVVDQRELSRPSPSYSIDSVAELVKEFPNSRICWLMGQDAFNSLHKWHRIAEFMQICHVVVAVRNQTATDQDEEVLRRIGAHRCHERNQLAENRGGYVYFAQTPLVDVSSTQIRTMIAAGRSPQYLLPGGVWNYIKRNRLYGYNEIKP